MQFNYYTTLLPGHSHLLHGVKDKYIWDHQIGKWQPTTHSAVQEATDRREWVCTELERIDSLRYKVMADWGQRTRDEYAADTSNKRKRDNEVPVTTAENLISDGNHQADEVTTPFHSSKRQKAVSLDNSASIVSEPTGELPRLSIEPPVCLPTPQRPIPDSQSTLSSLSTSTDIDHKARSAAPEPETPLRSNAEENATVHSTEAEESTAACLARYTFLLDIPTTDNQRVCWLEFLGKYNWNPAMISALRRFFMADPTPNMSQTKTFLERMKSVCETIEVESKTQGGESEETDRLLWDQRVKVVVDEMAVEAARKEKVKPVQQQRQPKWINTPDTSPLSSIGKSTPKTPKKSAPRVTKKSTPKKPKTPKKLRLKVSPSSVRVRTVKSPAVQNSEDLEADSDEISKTNNDSDIETKIDIPALMKQYVSSLNKGEKVKPPCDSCRDAGVECRINKTSCSRCARRHDRCVWTKVDVDEMKGLGLLGKEKTEDGEGGNKKKRQARSGKEKVSAIPGGQVTSGRAVRKRKRSAYGLTRDEDSDGEVAGGRATRKRKRNVHDSTENEDGDETNGFLNDDGSKDGSVQAVSDEDGDQTRAFLGQDQDSENEEDEWVPSS